jgi:hypothetical protein
MHQDDLRGRVLVENPAEDEGSPRHGGVEGIAQEVRELVAS